MALRWYVIRTKPQSDYLAAESLQNEGFELFFPRCKTPKPKAGRSDIPLFPGYLFLRFDFTNQDWSRLKSLPGILGWVRFNGEVPWVPDEIVADTASRVEAINESGGLWTRFKRGQRVQVVTGKLEGLAEVLEEPKSPESHVRVLLEFMGQMVSAQVPWHSLQPGKPDDGVRRRHRRTRGKGRWIRGLGPGGVPTT